MHPGDLVRAARRAAGTGQLGFARQAQVSERALGAIEAGTSDPRWSTVARLLSAGGMELTAVPVVGPPSTSLSRHLHQSTSERLEWSLTGQWYGGRGSDVWGELTDLTRAGRVHLTGAAAVGLWLPIRVTPDQLPVVLHPDDADLVAVGRSLRHLTVRVDQGAPPVGFVPVNIVRGGSGTVWVPPPLVLATSPDCAAVAQDLRAAAALLAAARVRDDAGRRAPAHRDPAERRERDDVLVRHCHSDRELPNPYDSRAWRLAGAASLHTWLQQHPQQRSTFY